MVARIIKALIDDGPMKKTRLSTYAEISYDKFASYLDWMVGRGLLKEENGDILVLEKGVETYNRLVEWILKYVGKLKFSRRKM